MKEDHSILHAAMKRSIPDCYDPVVQAERRDADWDKFVAKLPVCTLCKQKLFPEQKFHTACHMIVCPRCVDELNENYDFVEDPD